MGSRPPSRRTPPADTWFCKPPGNGYFERHRRPFDAIGDEAAGFGDELHGAVPHRRRDGVDQLGKRLLYMPIGVDYKRHQGPPCRGDQI